MSKQKLTPIQQELEQIRKANKGVLRPEDVVEFAQDPKTELHKRFTWDDSAAAHQHRLWEARMVIRVEVRVIEHAVAPMRAYVSLNTDRKQPGGGYRALPDVMKDKDKRAELLEQALVEARAWQRRYQQLSELAPIFSALDKVEEAATRTRPQQPARAIAASPA